LKIACPGCNQALKHTTAYLRCENKKCTHYKKNQLRSTHK